MQPLTKSVAAWKQEVQDSGDGLLLDGTNSERDEKNKGTARSLKQDAKDTENTA